MIIKNLNQLATNRLRKDALEIVEAGFEAVQTDHAILSHVRLIGNELEIMEHRYDLSLYENLYVIAFGKSSFLACKTLETVLGDRIHSGYAIGITEGESLQFIDYVKGTHPRPSEVNRDQSLKIVELVSRATERDLVLAVISGGGSALFSVPYKIDIKTQADIGDALMNAGAGIHDLNTVRKHLSAVKGGRLATLTYPAKLVAIILSDVPGNDLSTIASGATVMDHSTNDQAQALLEKFHILETLKLDTLELSETPKDANRFANVDNILVLDPTSAVKVMEERAKELGYTPRVLSTKLEGNAHGVGKRLLEECQPGEALIAAGETTIEVHGDGVGGRNQELVLANLENIGTGRVIISAASDGADHSSFAGAIGDGSTLQKSREMGLDPKIYLRNNDSYHYFEAVGDGLETGILDSNVSDMFLVLGEIS